MKIKFALSAGLILLTGVGLAFAGKATKPAADRPAAVEQQEMKVKELKDILFKLVRQDEYLDEAIESLDSTEGPIGQQDISALGFSLKSITKNLNLVSALNKTEFSAMQPGSNLSKYTNAILSYSRKVNRKAVKVNGLVVQLAASKKKAGMRDAVSSGKTGKKAPGKKLTQLLKEKTAVDKLAAEARNLRAASRGLSATSNWLYIASR